MKHFEKINVASILHALWLALVTTTPTAIVFGLLSWNHDWFLFPTYVSLHTIVFVGSFLFGLSTEDQRWVIIEHITCVMASLGPRDEAAENRRALRRLRERAKAQQTTGERPQRPPN